MLGACSVLSYAAALVSYSPCRYSAGQKLLWVVVQGHFGGSDSRLHILAFSFMGKELWRSTVDSAC